MALTIAVVVQRFLGRRASNWPLVYYAAVLGYTFGFEGSLHPGYVLAGVACALLIRFGFQWKAARLAELVIFALILWRCLGLLLMW